jgi:hypothetical protein
MQPAACHRRRLRRRKTVKTGKSERPPYAGDSSVRRSAHGGEQCPQPSVVRSTDEHWPQNRERRNLRRSVRCPQPRVCDGGQAGPRCSGAAQVQAVMPVVFRTRAADAASTANASGD